MAEYIDKELVIDTINELKTKALPKALLFDHLKKVIEVFSTRDFSPVKRGFWKPMSESEMTGFNPKFAGRDPIAGYKCSNCGNEAIFSCNDEFVLSDYCPNCGAKMDGGDENG